jgi:hypothetical protein
MNYLQFLLMLGTLSILGASCTKEVKFTKEALLKRAQQADPSVTYVLPRNMNDGINCQQYPAGCLSGHTVRVRGLEMIAVEFMTEEQAKFAAKKVRGYYARNWLFDDVMGEPDLEDFVKRHLEAQKP